MNLAALRALFRQRSGDRAAPFLFADADVDAWLNEGERQACKRMDLIHETEDEDLCTIATTEGTSYYTLDSKVVRVTRATWTAEGETTPTVLRIIDRVELERERPCWREDTDPQFLIVEDRRVRLPWTASSDGTLELEVYRLPQSDMAAEEDEPEIGGAHHEELIHWALFRGYGTPDTEAFDEGRGAAAQKAFDRYFGPPPDAERFRPDEERPNVVTAWV